MNVVKLSGRVTSVEVRRGPKQEWYLIFLETDHEDVIGIPLFANPPKVGADAYVEGELTSHNGYLRLRVKKAEFGRPARKRSSVTMVERTGP